MNTVKIVLIELKALYSDSSKWTQGFSAKDKNGLPVPDSLSPNATCFCLVGGLSRICYASGRNRMNTNRFTDTLDFLTKVINKRFGLSFMMDDIASWNDHRRRTFDDVIALIDKAIEQA